MSEEGGNTTFTSCSIQSSRFPFIHINAVNEGMKAVWMNHTRSLRADGSLSFLIQFHWIECNEMGPSTACASFIHSHSLRSCFIHSTHRSSGTLMPPSLPFTPLIRLQLINYVHLIPIHSIRVLFAPSVLAPFTLHYFHWFIITVDWSNKIYYYNSILISIRAS